MIKVHILTTCEHSHGEAYLPVGEAQDYLRRSYIRYYHYPECNGTGECRKWVGLGLS